MLAQWNTAIGALRPSIQNRDMPFAALYGTGFKNADLPDVPMDDLPAGSPEWMATENQWADRVGTRIKKRRTIQVVVPSSVSL
jgi:hypothetical protein